MYFDGEWENPVFVGSGGWTAWHQGMTPAMQAMKAIHPSVPLIGPGGTHSDDHTLIDLLAAIEQNGVRPDIFSAHVYFDKGWEEARDRVVWLQEVSRRFGYERFAVTESGVTGQRSKNPFIGGKIYKDGLKGTTAENFDQRLLWMKAFWDNFDGIDWVDYYQITEAGVVEDHGIGFGLFEADWTPKPGTRLWQPGHN